MLNIRTEKGITQISLITIIICLIILSGITISTVIGENGLLTYANKSKFETEAYMLNEKLSLYKLYAKKSKLNYDPNNLQWDGTNSPQNTAMIKDGKNEDTIETILEEIPSEFNGKIIIINGELVFKNLTDLEKQWVEEFNFKTLDNTSNESIANYIDDAAKLEDLIITTDTKGNIILNGSITTHKKYFIKLTNGIEIEELNINHNANEIFKIWNDTVQPFAFKNEYLSQKIEIISGEYQIKGTSQFNFPIRTSGNNPIMNCKVQENLFEYEQHLTEDALISYIYIENTSDSIIFNNLKLKVNIEKIEEKIEEDESHNLNIKTEYKVYDNGKFTCKINDDKSVTVNGSNASKMYVKITDGIDRRIGTMSDSTWVDNGTIIAKKGDKVKLVIKYIEGAFTPNTISKEFNCVIRNKSNKTVVNAKLAGVTFDTNNEFSTDIITLTEDITACYLFIAQGINCENYNFIPRLEIVE